MVSDAQFHFFKSLEDEFDQIPRSRKKELEKLSQIITDTLLGEGLCDIIVICTHNSRRSQLGELLLRTAAEHYGIEGINVYSGGTESTAFNYRMLEALNRAEFEFEKSGIEVNPIYQLRIPDGGLGQKLFSKKYDDPFNPQKDFIAIVVCNHADQNCPIVFGAKHRISLPYTDPKKYDGTNKQEEAYDEKVLEMGREMVYLSKGAICNTH